MNDKISRIFMFFFIVSFYPLASFILQIFTKNTWFGSSVVMARHFFARNDTFDLNQNFFKKAINISLMFLSVIFTVQLFFKKKLLQRILIYENTSYLRPKWPISPKRGCSRKRNNIFLIYLLSAFV